MNADINANDPDSEIIEKILHQTKEDERIADEAEYVDKIRREVNANRKNRRTLFILASFLFVLVVFFLAFIVRDRFRETDRTGFPKEKSELKVDSAFQTGLTFGFMLGVHIVLIGGLLIRAFNRDRSKELMVAYYDALKAENPPAKDKNL